MAPLVLRGTACAALCFAFLADSWAANPSQASHASRDVVHSILGDAQTARAGLGTRAAEPGIQVANTTYDFQHNDAVPHMIATNGGGGVVHFAYTWWFYVPDSLTQVERFVNFNTYDPSTGAFLFGPDGITIGDGEGNVRMARTGFPTLDIDDQDRAVVALHARASDQQPSGDFSSWAIRQQSPKLSLFIQDQLYQSRGTVPNADDDIIWPHVTVDQIAGASDVYHVVAHTYAVNDDIVYWRYKVTDVPQWQGPIVLDSTVSLSYNVAADRTSDKVALITIDGDTTIANPSGLRQVTYRESPDNGSSWIDGTGLGNSYEVMITSYNDPAGPQSWLEGVGDYDNDGNLHVIWIQQRNPGMWPGSGQCSLKHWDKSSGTTSTISTAFYDNKGMTGGRQLNIANLGIGFGNGSTTCNGQSNLDYPYVTYVQFGGPSLAEQNDKSAAVYGTGFMNGEIYLAVSNDSGSHWCRPVNLTNTPSPGCDPFFHDSCQSENWPSIARTVDDTIHIMYIADRDAGDCVFGQGRWTINPVMYYRIPGGTDVQPVCPAIEPALTVTLSNANGPECEYHAQPGGASVNETLALGNTGNGTMIGNVGVVYINPPSGSWLTISGAGAYTIPVGAPDLTYPVTMNPAGLITGIYQGVISITHNDPAQPNPFQIPVDFFVLSNFACPEYVVLHTAWLELEVSNIGRVAIGPNRSRPRGMYWPPYALSGSGPTVDSGFNSIFDGSLIIGRPPVDITVPPDGILDTVVYRYVYGTGNYAKGFRALSDLVVDTGAYGTGGGVVTARASQTTIDSLLGIEVRYELPQSADSSRFVLVHYTISNRTTNTLTGMFFGECADFDVVPSTVAAVRQSGSQNTAGNVQTMNLVYQQGIDSSRTSHNLAEKYFGGMTAIQSIPVPRAWSAPSDPWLFGRPGGGFSEGYLYSQMMKNNYEVKAPWPVPSAGWVDMHSVIGLDRGVTMAPATVKHYIVGFVSSTLGPTNTDLIVQTKKAWKFAFGWEDFVSLDTVPPGTASSYPYYAIGAHELGPTSGCCRCVITKTSDPGAKFSFTPDADPCTGTINFAGATVGTYTATFRLSTPSCSGPTYTEDRTVTVVVPNTCYCPHQGDIVLNGFIDVTDVLQTISVAFNNGTDIQDPGCPKTRCDVNNDGVVDVQDVIYVIKIAFTNGPAPINPCY
jgi:hypothetical protein